MRKFYKLLSSNYRANRSKGRKLTNRSYPIWCESVNHPRFEWGNYILQMVFDDELIFEGGNNVEV